MKRQKFLASGAAAVSLAGCATHGASLLPAAGASNASRQTIAAYSLSDQAKYAPAAPLPANPIVGEVRRFDGKVAPAGWAFCDGTILAIKANPSLYNVLGNVSGGDGKTTFALPKARKFTMVIAVAGTTPKSPRDLAAVFNSRPNRNAVAYGVPVVHP